jgi:hypothetical protein
VTDNENVPLVPDVPLLAKVLDDISTYLDTYVAFPSKAANESVCVWIVHTWCVEAFESTPRLALLSPEKQSGKTRLLECIDLLACNSLHTASTTASALFRTIGEGNCTVLMDEADSYLGYKTRDKHEDLRALVNTGHRRNAFVMRTERTRNGQEPRRWKTFAPIALAGIGDLPDTIMDRSVIISMKRRSTNEHVKSFRYRSAVTEAEPIVDALQRLQESLVAALENARPVMPPEIVDRQADVWEPLIGIADLAGHGWPEAIREASVLLNQVRIDREPSLGVRLLTDIRTIFGSDRHQIATRDLLSELISMIDSPWGNLRGSQLNERGLAFRLRKYEVSSKKIRFESIPLRGYRREHFLDAWDRWCPPLIPQEAEQVEHPEHPEQDPTRPF